MLSSFASRAGNHFARLEEISGLNIAVTVIGPSIVGKHVSPCYRVDDVGFSIY
jgi:hypothetical protein